MAPSWDQVAASKMTTCWAQLMALSLASSMTSSWAQMMATSSYNDDIKLPRQQAQDWTMVSSWAMTMASSLA
eukprot:5642776-Ditylum_brightwellii.AAC.1